jgi:hypothetical protein
MITEDGSSWTTLNPGMEKFLCSRRTVLLPGVMPRHLAHLDLAMANWAPSVGIKKSGSQAGVDPPGRGTPINDSCSRNSWLPGMDCRAAKPGLAERGSC